jgi:APA family basic amino acid/polyamine antiporter
MTHDAAEGTPRSPRRGHLLRVLGVGFGIAVTLGNTIGAGIFRTAGDVATHLPDATWFLAVWVLGGLFALTAASSLAELGAMIPRSGGHYVFIHRALGEYPGFVVGWTDWMANAGSSAAVSIVIGEFAGRLYPPLLPHAKVTACAVVLGFAALQWNGIRTGSAVQNLSSLLKALAFLALVIACFAYAGMLPSSAPAPEFPAGLKLAGAFILAMQSVIYAYDGWYGIIYFSEETRDPARDVPRSMFLGTLSVLAIYVLISAATLKVMPIPEIAGREFAIGAVASLLWGAHGDTVLTVLLIISMLSAVNAYQLMTCRIIYSMALDGLFHRKAAQVNAGGTPDFALGLSSLAAMGFILSGTFNEVVALMAFFFTCNYVADLASLFILRRTAPEHPRPYRAWGYPWTTLFALLAYSAFIAGAIKTDWANSRWSLLLLAVSYPVYRVFKAVKR